MSSLAPKTVNNVLTVLNTLLKKAVEWGEIERLPCIIKLLPNPKKTMGFIETSAWGNRGARMGRR